MVELSHEELKNRYDLLCRASQPNSSMKPELQKELSQLESLIRNDLVELTRQGCPDNITDILRSFDHELTRFRQFCEFPDLATKSIVGVGGGFSAGKSTFINKLIGKKCLAVEIDPTTSMPAYVLKGDQESIKALNMYDCAIDLAADELSNLTHEEKDLYGSQVGVLLKSAFVSLPDFKWANLAILDTPGYSKPEDSNWNANTDEDLARGQLNTADYIVWAVQADSGSISEQDIKFLSTLNKDIPKLVILTRAELRKKDIESITTLVETTLGNRGIAVTDVVPFSRKAKANFPIKKIIEQLELWNQQKNPILFAQNFKRLFIAYQSFIEEEKRSTYVRMDKINKILTMSEDAQTTEAANVLFVKVTQELDTLSSISEAYDELNHSFFKQLKQVGDMAGVPLPEPSSIELMDLKPIDLLTMLQKQIDEKGLEEPVHNLFTSIDSKSEILNRDKILRFDRLQYFCLKDNKTDLMNLNSLIRIEDNKPSIKFRANECLTRNDLLRNECGNTYRWINKNNQALVTATLLRESNNEYLLGL
ncbi:dynamin family protein [Vibrio nereis]|uniref:dynamin family protein n=1 Tax=Vibrio nereis TaxID=693 RepID=UPI0024947377|nr:dynamin family protein [Vibrio nereis]